jgi:signal transduction histidine kinase
LNRHFRGSLSDNSHQSSQRKSNAALSVAVARVAADLARSDRARGTTSTLDTTWTSMTREAMTHDQVSSDLWRFSDREALLIRFAGLPSASAMTVLMDEHAKKSHSGREATNQSLGIEREKTDEELAKRRGAIDEAADQLITGARKRADRILSSARRKADGKLSDHAGSSEQAAVKEERSREDALLRQERTTADETLLDERSARRRALAALLALEREQTDDHLLLERHRADAAVGSRDDFLGMVSHDLRNMLGGMAMNAISLTTIACEENVARSIARHANRIQQYTARMDRLVGDLLDVVSIEAGRLGLEPENVALSHLLSETTEAFVAIAAAKDICIHADAPADASAVRCDGGRILQVLANLVGNAIKFTPRGGRIDIRLELELELELGEVRFAVTDNGVGISPTQLALIFERFWQGDDRRTGVGLGLYISRCIVEAHGGKMWAISTPPEGSTFYFTLPGSASAA